MNRFYGNVGFIKTEEVERGVWEPTETILQYYGDVLNKRTRWDQPTDTTNGDLTISNVISIVADDYCSANAGYMRWVEWAGTKWKISSIEIKAPRIELTLGGVYSDRDHES